MIKEQVKQFIFGELYIIDIYTDNTAGAYVGDIYWTDNSYEELVSCIKGAMSND